jgi:hypothetical protein
LILQWLPPRQPTYFANLFIILYLSLDLLSRYHHFDQQFVAAGSARKQVAKPADGGTPVRPERVPVRLAQVERTERRDTNHGEYSHPPDPCGIIACNVPPSYSVVQYISDLRAIRATGAAMAETSFYPPLSQLLNAAGQTLNPAVLFSTQLRDSGAGIPDGGFFPVPKRSRRNPDPDPLQNPERGAVEIKPAEYDLNRLAGEAQTRRYLEQYGLVLIANLRQFRLLKLNEARQVTTVESYTLAETADALWHAPVSGFASHSDLLPDFLARVMLYRAPLVQPKDVAWVLASYAKEARARAEDHPLGSFEVVRDALEQSLGMRFEGEKGQHFFRSTLVQTLFYGIFSAWILWRRTPEGRATGARFDWRTSAYHLRVPVLRRLFNEVAEPGDAQVSGKPRRMRHRLLYLKLLVARWPFPPDDAAQVRESV